MQQAAAAAASICLATAEGCFSGPDVAALSLTHFSPSMLQLHAPSLLEGLPTQIMRKHPAAAATPSTHPVSFQL